MTQSLEAVVANPSPFDADAAYLQNTLRHEPMELALDDSVSFRTLALMVLRAYIASFIVGFVLGIIGIFEEANNGGPTVLALATIASAVVFWVVLLNAKVTEPIGEWRVLLADRAGQAEAYYRVVAAVLDRRKLPIVPTRRNIKLAGDGRIKHTMVLVDNEYQTYVTVFPYGTSLYVGWQMWRRRNGWQLIKRALTDRATAANIVTAMLRTDRARAVREAVHLACREAVYTPVDPELWQLAQQVPMEAAVLETALLAPEPATPALARPAAPAQPSAPAHAAPADAIRRRTAPPSGPAAQVPPPTAPPVGESAV